MKKSLILHIIFVLVLSFLPLSVLAKPGVEDIEKDLSELVKERVVYYAGKIGFTDVTATTPMDLEFITASQKNIDKQLHRYLAVSANFTSKKDGPFTGLFYFDIKEVPQGREVVTNYAFLSKEDKRFERDYKKTLQSYSRTVEQNGEKIDLKKKSMK